MRFLESFGQLTVDPNIRGCEVAGFEKGHQMRFDRQPNSAAVRNLACIVQGLLDGFEHTQQPKVQDLVENLLLGIEIVIDAARLDFRHGRDLTQRGGGVTLAAKQLGRRTQNRIA